jgi:hypothetical protein
LGATASHRGFTKSLANTDTMNPAGTCGRKFARGRVTTGPLSTRLSLDKSFARTANIESKNYRHCNAGNRNTYKESFCTDFGSRRHCAL